MPHASDFYVGDGCGRLTSMPDFGTAPAFSRPHVVAQPQPVVPQALTEVDVRRIVREEIDAALEPVHGDLNALTDGFVEMGVHLGRVMDTVHALRQKLAFLK